MSLKIENGKVVNIGKSNIGSIQVTGGTGSDLSTIIGGDLSNLDNLASLLKKAGYEKEAEEILDKPKLSVLQRLGRGLSAIETGNALYQSQYESKSFLKTYFNDILLDLGSAITGKEYRTEEKKTYADVLEKMGMTQREGKLDLSDVLGFGLDVFLDPSTYTGKYIAKEFISLTKGTVKTALTGVGKVAPKTEKGIKLAAEGVTEAMNKAFSFGYGTSKELANDLLETVGKTRGLLQKQIDEGIEIYGHLDDVEKLDLTEGLLKSKRSVTDRQLDILQTSVKELNKKYGIKLGKNLDEVSNKVAPLLGGEAKTVIKHIEDVASSKTGRLQKTLSKLASKEVKEGTADLRKIISELKKELPQTATKAVKETITDESIADNVINGIVSVKRKDLEMVISDLEKLIEKGGDEIVETATKKVAKATTRKAKIAQIQRKIIDIQNEVSDKSSLLQKIVNSRTIAKAEQNAPMFQSEKVAELYNKVIKPRVKEYSDIAGIKEPFEHYFPSIDKTKLNEFVKGTGKIYADREGYKKIFNDLLSDDALFKDPLAFSFREAQILRNKVVRDDLTKYVNIYGKARDAFKNVDEALAAGYKLVKEKGLYGKELGWLKEADKKFIDNMISPEFAVIDELAKATGFDYMTNIFKRFVTGLFAPFHVRNFVSGHIQNYEVLGLDALNPRNIADGMKATANMFSGTFKGTIDINGVKKSAQAIWEPFRKRFKDSSQYIADVEQYILDANSKGITSKMSKLNPLDTENYLFKGARTVGDFIETQQKAIAYVTSLRQGKTINKALELATKAGFDYRALTPFESKVMKRIIPFYAFSKNNVRLQLSTLAEHPERIGNITKLFRETLNPITDDDTKPEWMNERFMLSFGTSKQGEKQVLAGFGTPIEEFAEKFSGNPLLNFLAMGNPLLKLPLEKAVGKDFFRERDLQDVYTANEYSKAPQIIKDILKVEEVEKDVYVNGKKTGQKKTVYVADPDRLHIARNLFTSRMVSYLDTLFAEEDLTGKARTLKAVTGVKPYTIDEESVKYYSDKEKREKLESILKRLGIIKTFSKSYLPSTSNTINLK